jgi:hypothetical protein
MDLGYCPSMPLDIILDAVRTNPSARAKEGTDFAEHLSAVLQHARDALQDAKDQQTAQANKSRQEHAYKEGEMVFVSTKDMPVGYANAGPTSKLQHRFIGPFKILRIRRNAAVLDLPKELGVHPVFNVSKLKPDHRDLTRPPRPLPPLRHMAKTATGVYEVDKITDHRKKGRATEYRVKWLGYDDPNDDTWMRRSALKNAGAALDAYLASQQTRRSDRR